MESSLRFANSKLGNQITNGFEGKWGNWKGRKNVPRKHTWVNGFPNSVLGSRSAGDDTALNGLKIWLP